MPATVGWEMGQSRKTAEREKLLDRKKIEREMGQSRKMVGWERRKARKS